MVVSARKAISSRSSRKLKPIHYHNLFGYFAWNMQGHLFFFFQIVLLSRQSPCLISNLLTLWLSKTVEVEWKRNKRDLWVSFVSNFVFLACLFLSRFFFPPWMQVFSWLLSFTLSLQWPTPHSHDLIIVPRLLMRKEFQTRMKQPSYHIPASDFSFVRHFLCFECFNFPLFPNCPWLDAF